MIYLNPKIYEASKVDELKDLDIWPVDILKFNKHKYVMTSEGCMAPYKGYVGYYSHRDNSSKKAN